MSIYMKLTFVQNKHFPFIYCVEDLVYQRKHREWESCYEKLGLDSTLIDQCYRGEYGKEVSVELVIVLEIPCSHIVT